MSEKLEIEKDKKAQTCPAVGSQQVEVCLPVAVSPYAVTGPAKVQCCGEPNIIPNCNHCHGKINGVCEFTISQKINVDIPVIFGATVKVGDSYVDCGCVTIQEDDKCDCNCDSEQ